MILTKDKTEVLKFNLIEMEEKIISGEIGLVHKNEDGTFSQIVLNEDQTRLLHTCCQIISQHRPLVVMGGENDLVTKFSISKTNKL